MSYQHFTILGHLTRDPEMMLPKGKAEGGTERGGQTAAKPAANEEDCPY